MCRLIDSEKYSKPFETDTENWKNDQEIKYRASVTGYLWMKGIYNLHLLESDSKVLNAYLRYLYDQQNRKDTYYSNITILAFNEDCPKKWFDHWGSGDLNFTGKVYEEHGKSESDMHELSYRMYDSFFQASGAYAQKLINEKKRSKQLWKDIAEKINPNNEELFCLSCENFMNIHDYYSMYLDDLEVELESELHYPQNKTMIDILEYNDDPYVNK